MEKYVVSNISTALNHINNLYAQFDYLIKNEKDLNEKERYALYSYGLDKMNIDLIRLVNVKKSLKAICGNKLISIDK